MKSCLSQVIAMSVVATMAVVGVSRAADITAGPWSTDRYDPANFVVAPPNITITINSAQDAANRDIAYSSAFYNTQGKQQSVSVAAPWTVSADLFVASSFLGTELMRTDLWTRDSTADENFANYPILGITNQGGPLRYRAWDSDIGWVDLAAPVIGFDQFHNFSITSTGSEFDFRIDGALVYQDMTYSAPGDEALKTVFLEAYNFGPTGPSTGNYSVLWNNVQAGAAAPVPLPASVGVGFTMLAGFGAMFAARKRLSSKPRIA